MGFQHMLTKEEFEKEYAENSNLTVEELHGLGLYVEPCDCDYLDCKGWEMIFKKNGDTFYNIDDCSIDC